MEVTSLVGGGVIRHRAGGDNVLQRDSLETDSGAGRISIARFETMIDAAVDHRRGSRHVLQ